MRKEGKKLLGNILMIFGLVILFTALCAVDSIRLIPAICVGAIARALTMAGVKMSGIGEE